MHQPGSENPYKPRPHELDKLIQEPAFKFLWFEIQERQKSAHSGWLNDENEWKDDIAYKAIYRELDEILRLPTILKEVLQHYVDQERLANDLTES